MNVEIINRSGHALPRYHTSGSAGMDLCAFLPEEPLQLQPLQRSVVPTGLFLAIPKGFEAQVRPRSGLAIRSGLTVVNTPGTIDSDYRGEVMVGLINLSQDVLTINNGDRIAQIVFARYEQIEWQEQSVLDTTGRGEGGFGHTGI